MKIKVTNKVNLTKAIGQKMETFAHRFKAGLEDIITEIDFRTASGRDVNEAAFVPYSPDYAKFKAEKGRKATPDLTFTGQMLSSMRSETKIEGSLVYGVIKFGDRDSARKATQNNERRNFFGINNKQIQQLTTRVRMGD